MDNYWGDYFKYKKEKLEDKGMYYPDNMMSDGTIEKV